MHLFRSLCLSAVLLLPAASHADDEEISTAQLLERMADALETVNYEGTVVYLHGHRLDTLNVVHRAERGRVLERLVSLNGPPRSVTRELDRVTCEFPHSQPLSVKRRALGQNLIAARAVDPDALSQHYSLRLLGQARVAGRDTDVVGIIPADELRYGYRFFLDRDSGLPLKFDLIGQAAAPILQIMFTSLTVLPPSKRSAHVATQTTAEAARVRKAVSNPSRWRFQNLPPGFRVVMYDGWQDDQDAHVEHFLLSDGLASVSLYIESGQAAGLEGSSGIGAVHAAGGVVAGHQVTVVGEVPESTVDAVLASITIAREQAE